MELKSNDPVVSHIPMVKVKKPRISGPKLDRLCRRLSTWRWQTKGRRIECIRHHLRFEVLPKYSQTELAAALTWAEIGKGGKPALFDDVYATVEELLVAFPVHGMLTVAFSAHIVLMFSRIRKIRESSRLHLRLIYDRARG